MEGKKLKLKKKASPEMAQPVEQVWKILIVDDEQEVHSITKMILSDLVFKERKLSFIDAYSAREAELILRSEKDIAVILLDVVMESDNAGLELTKLIREELHNEAVRIILRTGQPGQAPEERVILDYDINDYKAKNELTARKLITSVVASLRAYDSIVRLQHNRQGLEKIIGSTDALFEVDSLLDFSSGVLTQLSAFIDCKPNGIMCLKLAPSREPVHMAGFPCEGIRVLGAAGVYDECNVCSGSDGCSQNKMVELARQALTEKRNCYIDDYAVLYLDARGFEGCVALLKGVKTLTEEDKFMLSLFTRKIALALANAVHYSEMISAQEAATMDFLTGLPNRRNLIDEANWLIDKHQENDQPYSVAVMDIDFFKQVNDNYGHETGDKVLKIVAQYLDAKLLDGSFAARIGGEEFCLFLTNTTASDAVEVFDRIRSDISLLSIQVNEESIKVCSDTTQGEDIPLQSGDSRISVSVSMGIVASTEADVKNADSVDIDLLMRLADSKLYEAKQNGRNQVVF